MRLRHPALDGHTSSYHTSSYHTSPYHTSPYHTSSYKRTACCILSIISPISNSIADLMLWVSFATFRRKEANTIEIGE